MRSQQQTLSSHEDQNFKTVDLGDFSWGATILIQTNTFWLVVEPPTPLKNHGVGRLGL